MFKSKYLKLSIIIILIMLIIGLKIYLYNKSDLNEFEDVNYSVNLTDSEIDNIKKGVLENSKVYSDDIELNDF